jgi:hypothetical protein
MRVMEKRFFVATDDSYVDYTVVAVDLDHAKNVLRDSGVEFGDPSVTLDKAHLDWSEIPLQRARAIRCQTAESDNNRGVIPLAEADIGEWFCTEY